MHVQKLCSVVLLVSVCVVSAHRESNVNGSAGVEIADNVSEDVFRQIGACVSDDDCHHLGRCETKDGGTKTCQCRKGTRGDFCETVEECVDNPVRCGTGDDVSCLFDEQLGEVVCKCDNDSKTYNPDEERCMRPCTSHLQCGQYGDCFTVIGDKRFCACLLGTIGDYCEIIEQCHSGAVDCGYNATCTLGQKGNAYCVCPNMRTGFDYDNRICRDCTVCGENSYNSCVYRNGKRKCYCKTRHYSSENGICEDCKCGQFYTGCRFENGTKVCHCFGRYAPNGDVCEECDCGLGSNCEFKDGKKVCTCQEGYIASDGKCKQMCGDESPCLNGGKCVGSVCSCPKGTSGDLCGTVDECRSTVKCGYADCLYNSTSGGAYCKCRDPKLNFDDYYKECRVCSCGSLTKSCAYVEGKKKCVCENAYADRLGTCTMCYCRGYSSMYGCKFDYYGYKICNCMKGYAQDGDECKRCDCGNHGNCTLSGWSGKSCSCDEGYKNREGTCEECDCGTNGRCYFDSWGRKTCSCNSGYEEYQGTCLACNCGENADCKFSSSGDKLCSCHSGYGIKFGICTACYCDPGTNCTFTSTFLTTNVKTCICPKGYANDRGSCDVCDCDLEGSNCTLDFGMTKCECPRGYQEVHDLYANYKTSCQDIDECHYPTACPPSTKCYNTIGSYVCECKEGYELIDKPSTYDIKVDGCDDIDECRREWRKCNDGNARCVNTPGSYRCECGFGYTVVKSYEEKRNICYSESRPWKIATIVVGCIAGAIITGLLIAIFKKYK